MSDFTAIIRKYLENNPHTVTVLEMRDRIEQLERELVEAHKEGDQWRDLALNRGDQLAAEKALADRRGMMLMRIEAVVPFESFGLGNTFADEVEAEVAAYRKARGL